MKYNHTQIGKIIIGGVLLAALISVVAIMEQDASRHTAEWFELQYWDAKGVLIICSVYLLVLNMATLTTRIKDDRLSWYFGVGLPRKSLSLSEIESVTIVRNKWWYGWGIRRMLVGGWLYNVQGLDAVEIKTRYGKVFRLGTDEPKKLHKVLTQQISRLAGAHHG